MLLSNEEMHVALLTPIEMFCLQSYGHIYVIQIVWGAKTYLPVQMKVFVARFSLVSH